MHKSKIVSLDIHPKRTVVATGEKIKLTSG